jgi:hypothetical protein
MLGTLLDDVLRLSSSRRSRISAVVVFVLAVVFAFFLAMRTTPPATRFGGGAA